MQDFSCPALLRCRLARASAFGYGALTLCGRPFQAVLLASARHFIGGPTTPQRASLHLRFGLLRVRSPLLAQSLLFSFPPGTEMFQFPGLAPAFWPVPSPAGGRVAPFGHPRFKGYLLLCAAFRSLSRPSSPPRAKASFMCPSLLSFFPLRKVAFQIDSFFAAVDFTRPAASFPPPREIVFALTLYFAYLFDLLVIFGNLVPLGTRLQLPTCQCSLLFV